MKLDNDQHTLRMFEKMWIFKESIYENGNWKGHYNQELNQLIKEECKVRFFETQSWVT